ncbi:MAG: cell division protein FtsA [Dictyoglomus sp.]|nr:cell division protein FtsA [Dictyoglomus sp.]MCX7942354.1 cell division protein FtsA [Dictyoglomaceae bacterium]MDW8188442.1 cell division protein FtsA [Dictyoglomus sp.]
MSQIFVGIDLGSTKIAALAGRIEGENIEILGFSLVPSQGIKYGNIVDVIGASNCIAESMKRIEKMIGTRLEQKVIVGIGNDQMMVTPSKGMVIMKSRDQEISPEDVERAIEAAKMAPLPPNREIIYTIKREFHVDGQNSIENPVGLIGTRLEADVLLVSYDNIQLKNIKNAFERANLEIEGFIPKEIAASEAVLSSQEKKLGVALVDIGGDLTNLAIYQDGSVLATGVLRLGGERITRDLAVGLRIKIEEAEKVKKILGTLKGEKEESLEVISLQEKKIKVSSFQVREILQPRVEEILEFIEKKLRDLNYPLELIPGGLVITGGTSLLDGFVEFASEYLKIPVRRGYPLELSKYIPEKDAYFYSVAMGLLLRVREDKLNLREKYPVIKSIKNKIKKIFKPFREMYF